MIDFRLALMVGVDIPLPEFQLIVHVPTIRDIARMGEKEFFIAAQYLCIEKEKLISDKNVLQTYSNFQVLMRILGQSQDKEKKNIISTLLTILFPKYNNIITPRAIVFSSIDDKNINIMIDDTNFETFKGFLKEILCINDLFQGENPTYNPGNKLAKEIAEKIMRGRLRAAELNSKKQSEESILVRYISILVVAGVTTLKDCADYNLFQLFDLIERYMAYMEWDVDLQVRLQGGKPDKQVESWMRDLHTQTSTAFTSADGINVYQ